MAFGVREAEVPRRVSHGCTLVEVGQTGSTDTQSAPEDRNFDRPLTHFTDANHDRWGWDHSIWHAAAPSEAADPLARHYRSDTQRYHYPSVVSDPLDSVSRPSGADADRPAKPHRRYRI